MTYKKLSLFIALQSILFLTGCSQGQHQISQSSALTQHKFANAPKWVSNPELEGGIAALGIAPNNPIGMQFQRVEAIASGREELSRMIDVKVEAMVKNFSQVTGVGTSSSVDKVASNVSKQVSKSALSGSKIKDMWIAPDNELYVLVVVTSDSLTPMIKDAVKTSFKNDQALWQQFQAKKAQEELDLEISKLTK